MDDKERTMRDAADDAAHSATADKAKGRTNETIGKVKSKIGSVIGDRDLQAKGDAQRIEGKKDRFKGEIKDKVEDVKEYAKAGVEVVKDKFDRNRDKK